MFESINKDQINLDLLTETNKIFASSTLDTSNIIDGTNSDLSLTLTSPDLIEIGTFEFKIGKDKIKPKKEKLLSRSSMNKSKSTTNVNINYSSPIRQGSNTSNRSEQSSNRIQKHHMSSFTFSDPLSQFPGAGTQEIGSTISNDQPNKIKQPSYTFGTMHNFPKLYLNANLAKGNFGSQGVDIKYNPNIDTIKNHAFVPTIGNIKKIDEHLQAPLRYVSPGPVYDVTAGFGLRHSTKFPKDIRLKKDKSESAMAGYLFPSMGHLENSPKSSFTSNHQQWHKTFSNEKERQMTCKGETAAYNERDLNRDFGDVRSTKQTVGKTVRDCNKDVSVFSPGPGFQNNHVKTVQVGGVTKLGSFGKSSRLFNVTKMDRYFNQGMKTN